jgi:hypothetical protein
LILASEMSVGLLSGPGEVGLTDEPALSELAWPIRKVLPLLPRPGWWGPCDSKYPPGLCPLCPVSSRILPCSLPYGGGGAKLPVVGASPHFFTFASMNTNPSCPKFTCTVQGPLAPTVGKRLSDFSPWATSSSFLPFRVKKIVPVRGRYPTPMTSP